MLNCIIDTCGVKYFHTVPYGKESVQSFELQMAHTSSIPLGKLFQVSSKKGINCNPSTARIFLRFVEFFGYFFGYREISDTA